MNGYATYRAARAELGHVRPRLTNVSNLAAYGVEYIIPGSTTVVQLVNLRDTAGLVMGMKDDSGRWFMDRVSNPERFLDSPPRSYKEFLIVVDRWFDAILPAE